MNATELPIELKKVIENEKIDFLIKAKRNYPLSKLITGLIFSIVWCSFTSVLAFAFLGPLFKSGEVHFKSNDEPVTASWDDLSELLMPSLIIGLFAIIGIILLTYSIYSFLQKGGYFIGTETRLIRYRKGKTIITDWEQFTGNVEITNKNSLGNLEYQLRTGKMQSRKNESDKFVPDIIYISGIENVYEIEKKCKIRIKENDPTPVVQSN